MTIKIKTITIIANNSKNVNPFFLVGTFFFIKITIFAHTPQQILYPLVSAITNSKIIA